MRPVQHIVNVSGGKDSDSCALLAKERGIPFRMVRAETDNEHELTHEHIRTLERNIGQPVEVVKADFSEQIRKKREYIRLVWPTKGVSLGTVARAMLACHPTGNAYLDLCIWKGRFPSRMAQFCTEELKIFPVLEQIILPALKAQRRGEAGPVLRWLGERSQESKRRREKPRFNRDDSGCYLWRPIKAWTWEDVVAMHVRHGLPMNPLYSQGMGRVGCMPCINARKDEIRQIATRFPDHIDKIAEWENIVRDACRSGSATFFPAVTDPTDPDRPGTYSGVHVIAEWSRTARGGRQYDLVHEMEDTTSGCHSSYGLCE